MVLVHENIMVLAHVMVLEKLENLEKVDAKVENEKAENPKETEIWMK